MAVLACRAVCVSASFIAFHISASCCIIGYYICMLKAPVRWVCCLLRILFMSCSTLDPVLRMERQGVTPQGLALILAITAYLFAKPGVLAILSFKAELQLFNHCLHVKANSLVLPLRRCLAGGHRLLHLGQVSETHQYKGIHQGELVLWTETPTIRHLF